MTTKDPKDSVRDEQFDADEKTAEITDDIIKIESKDEETVGEGSPMALSDLSDDDKPAPEVSSDDDKPAPEVSSDDDKSAPEASSDDDKSAPEASIDDDKSATEVLSDMKEQEPEELAKVDYSGRSKSELLETLELLIDNRSLDEIIDDVEKIKILFYKRHKVEQEEMKIKFLSDGGKLEDYKPREEQDEVKFKNLLARFRGKKTELNRQLEIEKQNNLKRKYGIIDQIKDLVNREESINKTFQEFRDLQSEWHSLGMVPQSSVRNLWETYNHNVEIFYDYIKINKELRDLDFKKNLETKIKLCERAEGLLQETNPVSTFRTLQEHHQRWREIGPVPRDSRSEIWERFKLVTSTINRRHHEHFEKQKDEQKKNLEAKAALCDKIEEINKLKPDSFREWDARVREVLELQKEWRTIGFTPKKHNNSIYQQFREACDSFFQSKRKFYSENKEEQTANLQLKVELCVQAEAQQDSSDWKETTDVLIKLQKQWKEVGVVHRKHSEKIWKRFRKACDHFFDRKSEHFSEQDSSFENNLKLKLQLVEELEKSEAKDDSKEAFERLQEIQKKWNEIGFVPYKSKDEITNRYRNALNTQFDRLTIDDEAKSLLRYQNKIENLKETSKVSRKLRTEREKFVNKLKMLESDIIVWENNIGFFSKSSNADSMIKEVQLNIETAKKNIQVLKEKIKMIDQSGLDE